MSFLPDGKYLATAGEDGKILIWSVSPKISKINRKHHGNIFLRSSGSAPLGTEVQLLSSRQAPGATDTTDPFLFSASLDKTIRLWHVSRPGALNGRVKAWAQCPDIITAAQYSPNGNLVVAGLMKGQVYFYMTWNEVLYAARIQK